MCQNKEVSILLVIFALAVIMKLCNEYKKTNEIKYLYASVYIGLLGFVQLVEFFIHWYSVKTNVYQIASLCVVFAIVAQFIFSEIIVYKYGNVPSFFYAFDIIFYMSLIYFLPTLYNNFGNYDNKMECSNWFGCKLKWDSWDKIDRKNIYISIFLKLIYLFYFGYATYLLFDIPGLIIYVMSFSIIYLPAYYYKFMGKHLGGTGSAWCILAILIMLLLIIDFPFEKTYVK